MTDRLNTDEGPGFVLLICQRQTGDTIPIRITLKGIATPASIEFSWRKMHLMTAHSESPQVWTNMGIKETQNASSNDILLQSERDLADVNTQMSS